MLPKKKILLNKKFTFLTKSELHYWIIHVRISLSAKFQLKLDNFDFLD